MLPRYQPRFSEDSEVAEEVVQLEETRTDRPWVVLLYNDDIHTFDEVIHQLVKATACSLKEAEAHAWTVHTKGKATVYQDEMESCLRVQSILREIELITEVRG